MGATSSVLAGLLVVGAGVALYRFAQRKSGEFRAAIEEIRHASRGGATIDLEKDPATGVYRRRA